MFFLFILHENVVGVACVLIPRLKRVVRVREGIVFCLYWLIATHNIVNLNNNENIRFTLSTNRQAIHNSVHNYRIRNYFLRRLLPEETS